MGYDEPSSKRSAVLSPVRTRKTSPRLILIAVLLLGAAGYVAVQSDMPAKMAAYFGGGGGGAGRGAPPPPVRVASAVTKDVPVVVSTIGTVLANSVVTVKAQVDGPLLSANFREGQMVRRGDLLFRIDPAPFEAALRQAEANAERDRAQQASAQADADRAVMLADRGIVSAQQRDQLVASAKALAASVLADEAAVDRAKLNLGYTTIRSPIDGKTGAYTVYPGNQVHVSDQAGLITITQIQPVKITFNLPQANLPRLQDRLAQDDLIARVNLRNDAVEAASATGPVPAPETGIPVKVDFIGNTIDARTGTIELRATFANPDLRFVPGELIDAVVTLETLTQAVVIPHEAVNVGQEGTYVFVISADNKVEMRSVQVAYEDQFIAAIGTGIKSGERVVIDGQLRLTPGITVNIVANAAESPVAGTPAEGAVQNAAAAQGG